MEKHLSGNELKAQDPLMYEAFGAFESQMHDSLYGGDESSVFLNDEAWRKLEPDVQDNLWSAGVIQNISLVSELDVVQRTGIGPNGHQASDEYVEELQRHIVAYEKRLQDVRTRLGKTGLKDGEA